MKSLAMPLRTNLALALALWLMLSLTGAARACEASRQLADFSETYSALLQTQSLDDWQETSAVLNNALNATDAASLGRDLGAEGAPADISRLSRLLADASALLNGTWSDRARHTTRTLENLTYVDRLVAATGCDIEPVSASQRGESTTDADDTGARAPDDRSQLATARNSGGFWIGLLILALLCAAGMAGAVMYLQKNGTVSERKKRRKRHLAVIPVMVTPNGGTPDVADTVDISLDGVKLSWKGAPGPGALVEIDFGAHSRKARMVWSNAYFAGLHFDAGLSEDDLSEILNRNNTP